ncbi:unnamed protein product [Polarella glacialis]|uniref:Uncharacterized protein n=1 Tax=Polarella glacialis TaxID=89957 RepID=A0A813DDC9_POLGL|nr:unnamed protein product [Polarella glacialis]
MQYAITVAVLSRYSAQAQNLDREKLLRIAVHVGAWVALLPLEQAASSPRSKDDVSQPSPVQLLAQILRLRARAKITDWLQGVLHLVALRLQDVRRDLHGQAAVPWMELRRSMPKAIWRDLRTQLPAIPLACGESKEQQELADPASQLKRKMPSQHTESAGQRTEESAGPVTEALTASDFHLEISELGNKKAVRRFHRDGAVFSNSNLEERALHVDSLEERLVKAVASESWDRVCSLIKEAAAALVAPRQNAALNGAAVPMPDDAQERLQANLQGRLRKLICKGLGYLDLSDVGTASHLEPALSYMKLLIERFKVRGQLDEARAAKQWLRLQCILTAEATAQAEADLESLHPEGGSRRYFLQNLVGKKTWTGTDKASTRNGVYTPSERIQCNPLTEDKNNLIEGVRVSGKAGSALQE